MKRTKKLFALVVSAVFALSLVPAQAWGEATYGRIDDSTQNTGKITVNNAKANETYKFWRMFTLVSFRDSDPSTGAHPRAEDVNDTNYETYSYAIAEDSPWFEFLTTYGPDSTAFTGTESQTPYAVYTDETNETRKNAAYFLMDKQTSVTTLANGQSYTYHVIKANREGSFTNDWDSPDSTSSRIDEGTPASDNIDYSSVTTDSNTSTKDYNRVQDFAQSAIAYAEAKPIAADYTEISPAEGSSVITINGLPLGYYLMGTSMGTLASLDTTNRNVNIYEKNDEPSIEKNVLKKGESVSLITPAYLTTTAGDGDAWVNNTDADINDLVQFRTVITAQQGADSYVLHDVMEAGFKFVDTTSAPEGTSADGYEGTGSGYTFTPRVYLVKGGDTVYEVLDKAWVKIDETNTNQEEALNWVLMTETNLSDGCDFEIAFKDGDSRLPRRNPERAVVFGAREIYKNGAASTGTNPEWVEITDGDKIVVTYWARVTPQAAIYSSEGSGSSAATVATNESGDPTVTIGNQPNKDYDGSGRNENHTILTYGDKSYTAKFESSSVTTYAVDIAKTTEATVDTNGVSKYEMLNDAEFSVYKVVGAEEALDGDGKLKEAEGYASFKPMQSDTTAYYNKNEKLSFVEGATDDGQSTVLGSDYTDTHTFYRYAGDNAGSGGLTTIKSKDGKALHLYGLEAGAYVIVESKAPSGYNKLAHPVVVTIISKDTAEKNGTTEGNIYTHFHPNDNTTTTHDDQNITWKATITKSSGSNPNTYVGTSNGGAHIVNQSGKELPSTGGIGTTVFYVAGGALLVGAAVLFVTKRRMSTDA